MRAWVIALVLLVVYAALGQRHAAVWVSDLTLWRYAAAETPGNPLAEANRAVADAGQR